MSGQLARRDVPEAAQNCRSFMGECYRSAEALRHPKSPNKTLFFIHAAIIFVRVCIDFEFRQIRAAEIAIQRGKIGGPQCIPTFHYILCVMFDGGHGFGL